MVVAYSYSIPIGVLITDEKKDRFSSAIQADNSIMMTLEGITVSEQQIIVLFSGNVTQSALMYLDIIKDHCIISDTDVIYISKPSHNRTASSEPTIHDDRYRNYDISSQWIYDGFVWTCSDNSVGNAIWNRVIYENEAVSIRSDGAIQYTMPSHRGGENQVLAIEDGGLVFKHGKHAANTIVHNNNDQLDIRIDPTGATILMSDGGSYPVNTIRAISNENGMVDIITHSAGHYIYRDIRVASTTIKSVLVSQTVPIAVNEMNSLFTQTASISGSPPVITSSLSVTISEQETLNYELTTSYGVGYEWVTLPPGVVVSTMNRRKLIGGSGLAPGDYQVVVKAINYYGCDEKTIILTVSPLPYSNTRSIKFDDHEYLESEAGALHDIFGRSSNGTGAPDAWSVSIFFKPGDSADSKQTIFYYGTSDKHDEHIYIRYAGYKSYKNICFQYGSYDNYLLFKTQSYTITDPLKWYHLFLTYDGGETGVASDDLSSYYSRFKLYIDGVIQVTTNTHKHYGLSGGFGPDARLSVGRYYKSNYMRENCKVDEIAVWDSDRSADVSDIYNNGVTHTLSLLPNPPVHWWRMGDGDSYPSVQDNTSDVHLTMYNMTIDNITTDAP